MISFWIPNADHMPRMTAAFDMRSPDVPSKSIPTAHVNHLRCRRFPCCRRSPPRRPASPSTPPLPLGPPSARPLPAAALDDDAPVSALALAAATLAVSSLATSASPEERVAIRINIIIYRLVLVRTAAAAAWTRKDFPVPGFTVHGLHPFSRVTRVHMLRWVLRSTSCCFCFKSWRRNDSIL